jgi:hypothetical protein
LGVPDILKAARRCAQPGKTKEQLENSLKTTMILMEVKPRFYQTPRRCGIGGAPWN